MNAINLLHFVTNQNWLLYTAQSVRSRLEDKSVTATLNNLACRSIQQTHPNVLIFVLDILATFRDSYSLAMAWLLVIYRHIAYHRVARHSWTRMCGTSREANKVTMTLNDFIIEQTGFVQEVFFPVCRLGDIKNKSWWRSRRWVNSTFERLLQRNIVWSQC